MAFLERNAVLTEPDDIFMVEQSGPQIADLIARLPFEAFAPFKSRLLNLYARAGKGHWLWDANRLVSRISDFGIDALPYVSSPFALSGDRPGIQGLCRIGPPAKAVAEPILVSLWRARKTRISDSDALYVAMRRIGIEPPKTDLEFGFLSRLQERWPDVSPQSASDVCLAF
jgi:hypothetical protein